MKRMGSKPGEAVIEESKTVHRMRPGFGPLTSQHRLERVTCIQHSTKLDTAWKTPNLPEITTLQSPRAALYLAQEARRVMNLQFHSNLRSPNMQSFSPILVIWVQILFWVLTAHFLAICSNQRYVALVRKHLIRNFIPSTYEIRNTG